ncbi:hypothetical protein ACJ41O_005422 [Fusarium nematophilum]
MGPLLFDAGYDVGVMGGLLPFDSFKQDFGLPTESSGFADGKVAEVSSNVVSLLTAGCCVGSLSAAFANDRYGRRYSLMAYSAIFLLVGLISHKESPRWLVEKGRDEQALSSLAYIRNMAVDSPEVSREFVEIKTSLNEEEGQRRDVTWRECLKPGVRNRFALIIAFMVCQQLTGTNSIGYYAPQIFQTVGLSGADASLFATGIYGIVKLVFTAISLLFIIGKIGRRSCMMFILAAVLATHPPKEGERVSSASIAMCVLTYLYVIAYTGSESPGEIFPTHVRSYGVAFAATTQWLFNFMITRVTPQIIHDIGWKTFIVFASLCLGMSIFTFIFMKETKGLTLEEIDQLFGLTDIEQFRNDVEKKLTKLEGLEPVAAKVVTSEEKGDGKK